MCDDEVPSGLPFSRVYIKREEPQADSARMRRRIYHLFSNFLDDGYTLLVQREQGVELPYMGYGISWEKFFNTAELRDVLDAITHMSMYLDGRTRDSGLRHEPRRVEQMRQEVARIFREEHVHYRLDELGGVHYAVDDEFQRNYVSAIEALGRNRYGAVRDAFEGAQQALDRDNPNSKEALRNVFEALEILFKLMFDVRRLGAAEIKQHLLPTIDRAYNGDATARQAAHKLAQSLIDWVDGVHFYRHGQAVEEAAQPPLGLTVALMSGAASYLRWLAELDVARQAA